MINPFIGITKVFRRQALDEIAAREMEAAALEAQQAQHVIEEHRYLRHMALSKMAALEAWNRGDILARTNEETQ